MSEQDNPQNDILVSLLLREHEKSESWADSWHVEGWEAGWGIILHEYADCGSDRLWNEWHLNRLSKRPPEMQFLHVPLYANRTHWEMNNFVTAQKTNNHFYSESLFHTNAHQLCRIRGPHTRDKVHIASSCKYKQPEDASAFLAKRSQYGPQSRSRARHNM